PLHHPPSSTLFPYTTLFRSRHDEQRLRALDRPLGRQRLHRGRERARHEHDLDLQDAHLVLALYRWRHHLERRGEDQQPERENQIDRKSTRLNSSHRTISYAV